MIQIFENQSLLNKNTFAINSIAKYYISISAKEELLDIPNNIRTFVLGGGSNVVLPPYFDGLILDININGFDIVRKDSDFEIIKVGAGESWDNFVFKSISQGLFGFENLALIPGKVGAAPIQNIGAYGIEQDKYFYKLEYFDLESNSFKELYKTDCQFGYRNSVFKSTLKNKAVITNVYYRLPKNWEPIINYKDINEFLSANKDFELSPINIYNLVSQIRKSKLPDPAYQPNAGSFFKNPIISRSEYEKITKVNPEISGFISGDFVKLSAAKLIEIAGWKGKGIGINPKAKVSPDHSLVITGSDGVNQEQIILLSDAIINDIYKKFGILLEREVNIIQ